MKVISEDTQKRVLALHDLSCFGSCSLTVALPIISAFGHDCIPLPNSLLSTHTGIDGFTMLDLTPNMRPIMEHWGSLGLDFDCIYTGFLGNDEQIDIAADTIDRLADDDTLVVVDPAMADNGELYPTFGPDFPAHMRKLCARADILKPNITEACFLLGLDYRNGPYTEEWIHGILRELSDLGPGRIVLTGVYFDNSELGAAIYDREADSLEYIFDDTVPGIYYGTGDIFCSVLVGALTSGKTLRDSVELAVEFTREAIARTYKAGTNPKYGVNYEAGLPGLIRRIGH